MPAYRVELHSHCQGDPVDTHLSHSLTEHLDQARRVGLDAIAITWHQKICADADALAYAKKIGLLAISGMEAEIGRKHLVVLNLREGDLSPTPTWDELRALRARRPGEILVIAPHPFYPHPTCLGHDLNGNEDCIDAVEWCMLHVHWLPARISPNLRAARWAQRHGKPLVACSDAHALHAIGRNASTVEADELSPGALFAAIRAHRVSFHRQSLNAGAFLRHTAKAMASQPRHVGRWVAAKLAGGN